MGGLVDRASFADLVLGAILVLAATVGGVGAAPRQSTVLPLRYEATLIARGFDSPMLRASVRGQAVWFIVDTGASVNTLASWLASAAHLALQPKTATTTGSTGVEVPVNVVARQRIVLQTGRELTLREAIVVEFPPIFAELKIGGLVSPQLLATARNAAVLDLTTPALTFEPFTKALAKLGREAWVSEGSSVCRNANSPFDNRLYAAAVSAEGIAGTFLVDTGATTTLAAPGSSIAAALSGRATGSGAAQGVGGSAQTTREAPDVRLERGGSATTIPVSLGGAPPSCGPDGLIGMDALRDCVLVLGDSAFAWSCRAR